jgi:hypothetical protein
MLDANFEIVMVYPGSILECCLHAIEVLHLLLYRIWVVKVQTILQEDERGDVQGELSV